MLSDEEKKAIESLIEIREFANLSSYKDTKINQLNSIDVVLNLIEKQSKEIEHQIEKRANQKKELAILNAKQVEFNKLLNSYKGQFKEQSKEIKKILGIEEETDSEKILSLLQTIVDENARLEDIEDRKVQIEYNNVFNKGVKSVEDKIKAKIEPKLKELDEQINEEWKKYGNSKELQDMEDIYNFLQSLL